MTELIAEPKIIYEDKDFVVIDKPAGFMVHGLAQRKTSLATAAKLRRTRISRAPRPAVRLAPPLLTDWLLARYPEIKNVGDDPATRPGIVHRLDKDTSGVMIVPRNQKYFEYVKALFARHEIKKTYLAVVAGAPTKKEGTIDAAIGIRSGTMKRSIRSAKMAKAAVTSYKVLKTFMAENAEGRTAPFSLLEVSPETGRTHQIRVHLASIGHPIVGDPIYGPKKQPPWAQRLMLHARAIEFPAASGTRVRFEADIPSYPQFF